MRRIHGLSGKERTCRKTQQHLCRYHADGASQDEPLRTVLVEEGPDVDAAEEDEKHVRREDPSDGALAVAGELVRADVGMERCDGVGYAEG